MRAASTHGNAVVKASGHRVGIFEVGFYLLMADPTNPVVAFVDCMFWDWFVCDAVVRRDLGNPIRHVQVGVSNSS